MSNSTNGTAGQKIVDRLKTTGVNGLLVTIFVGGIAIAVAITSNSWAGANASLQERLHSSQEKISELTEELAQVKEEYASYRQEYPAVTGSGVSSSGAFGKGESEEVLVQEGTTAVLFDGNLFISVVTVNWTEYHIYKVTAVIGSLEHEGQRIENEEVGYATTYQGESKFDIRVMALGSGSATFLVTRLQEKT